MSAINGKYSEIFSLLTVRPYFYMYDFPILSGLHKKNFFLMLGLHLLRRLWKDFFPMFRRSYLVNETDNFYIQTSLWFNDATNDVN